MHTSPLQRILALDLHPRSFAFAVFEGPWKLVDWGARSFRRGLNAVVVDEGRKLAHLLDRYVPRLILLQVRRARRVRRMLAVITNEAALRHIPVRALPPKAFRQAFPETSRSKYEIAATIAGRLPELRSILPPRRKPWQSERYPMCIFDAAAAGIAHFTPSHAPSHSPNLSNGPRG
jgi:hypothetical protein